METMVKPTLDYLSPETMHRNPAYSQGVAMQGAWRTIYIGGQNAVNQAGEVIGKGDMKAQAEQVLKNVKAVLKAGGATFNNIIKWNVYVLQGQSVQPAFEVFQKEMKTMAHPPLVTMIQVAGLANPDFLMEVEGIAVVSE